MQLEQFRVMGLGKERRMCGMLICDVLQTVRLWGREHGKTKWDCTAVLKHKHVPRAISVISPSLVLTTSGAEVLLWREARLLRRFSVGGQSKEMRHLACMDTMVVGAAENFCEAVL